MATQETSTPGRRNPPPVIRDEQPLLRLLVAEATRRGDTLLFHELEADTGHSKTTYQWLNALQQAAAGSVQGLLEIAALRRQSSQGNNLF